MSVSYAVGADSGAHAAWALVRMQSGELPELVHLAEVYGSTDRLWLHRAYDGARLVRAELGRLEVNLEDVPCWVEVPPPKSRASAKGVRHTQVSWSTLGVRAGALWMAWWAASQSSTAADRVEPGVWWKPWGPTIRRGKDERDGGAHRVVEAGKLVGGASTRLAQVSESRRVDCAESILIAGGAALAVKGLTVQRGLR